MLSDFYNTTKISCVTLQNAKFPVLKCISMTLV